MTKDEIFACRAIEACHYAPGSWAKRFANNMGSKARTKPDTELTSKQRDALWRQVISFRLQIANDRLVETAKKLLAQSGHRPTRSMGSVPFDETLQALLTGYADGDLSCLAVFADRLEEMGCGVLPTIACERVDSRAIDILQLLRMHVRDLAPVWPSMLEFPDFRATFQNAHHYWAATYALTTPHFWSLRPEHMVVHNWSLFSTKAKTAFKRRARQLHCSYRYTQQACMAGSIVLSHAPSWVMEEMEFARAKLDASAKDPAITLVFEPELPLFEVTP